jgi:hypothetical protein
MKMLLVRPSIIPRVNLLPTKERQRTTLIDRCIPNVCRRRSLREPLHGPLRREPLPPVDLRGSLSRRRHTWHSGKDTRFPFSKIWAKAMRGLRCRG